MGYVDKAFNNKLKLPKILVSEDEKVLIKAGRRSLTEQDFLWVTKRELYPLKENPPAKLVDFYCYKKFLLN